MKNACKAFCLFLSFFAITFAHHSHAQDVLPFIQVKHQYKNLRMQVFPMKGKGEPDYLEHLIRSASVDQQDPSLRLMGHELTHVVQQSAGKKIVSLTLQGKFGEATKLTGELVKYLGKTVSPFDVSLFIEAIQQQVMFAAMPAITIEAAKVAKLRQLYQRNQSDLDFLKRTVRACVAQKCDKYSLETMYKEMEELNYAFNDLKLELEKATHSLTEAAEKYGKLYGPLLKASKARHDIAMNAIRNMKA